MEEEPILHVWINHDHDLVDLTLTTFVAAQHGKPTVKTNEVIHTNQKHPFFTKERGFLPVGQITLGMHVLRADGTYGVVPGVRVMYNLEVAQDHTFTVGMGQWVVHNCGGSDLGSVNNPEIDSQSPGDYWRQSSLNNAPRQTTPGTKVLNGVHVNNLGEEEPWTAYYDDYGRMAARTDYTRGNQAAGIPPIHYHIFEWNDQYPLGRELPGHFPGEYVP
jgi:hypothetical protein